MEEVFLTFDKWNGLVFLIVGIYGTLIAFRVITPNKNPKKMELWHQRLGPMMKIISPIIIIFGIAKLTGILNP